MPTLGDLFKFEIVEAFEFRVASSQGISGFTQIIARIAVSGADKSGILGFEITRFMLFSDESRIFRESSLSGKPVDVAGFRDDL